MNNELIKLLVVDDHPLVRKGLISLFETSPKFDVVGQVDNGNQAIEMITQHHPDIMITDISMEGMNGIELTEKALQIAPDLRVLVLTMHLESEYIIDAFNKGVSAYLNKDSKDEEILEALEVIYAGKKYLTPTTSEILASAYIGKNRQSNKQDHDLTPREIEILKFIVDGYNNKQIAAELFVSIRTVDTHRTNIMRKIGASNAAELVRITLKMNLI